MIVVVDALGEGGGAGPESLQRDEGLAGAGGEAGENAQQFGGAGTLLDAEFFGRDDGAGLDAAGDDGAAVAVDVGDDDGGPEACQGVDAGAGRIFTRMPDSVTVSGLVNKTAFSGFSKVYSK